MALYAAYACNEGTGNVIKDYSGNNRNLTLQGSGNTWVAGHGAYGKAFKSGPVFAGAEIDFGAANPDLSGDVTILGWYKDTDDPVTVNVAFGMYSAATVARCTMYAYRSLNGVAASPQATIRNSSSTVFSFGQNATSADSSWHHGAVTYKSDGTVTVYKDGTQVATGSAASAIGTQVRYIGIGSRLALSSTILTSAVQDMRVFTDVLTPAAIQACRDTPITSGQRGRYDDIYNYMDTSNYTDVSNYADTFNYTA